VTGRGGFGGGSLLADPEQLESVDVTGGRPIDGRLPPDRGAPVERWEGGRAPLAISFSRASPKGWRDRLAFGSAAHRVRGLHERLLVWRRCAGRAGAQHAFGRM